MTKPDYPYPALNPNSYLDISLIRIAIHLSLVPPLFFFTWHKLPYIHTHHTLSRVRGRVVRGDVGGGGIHRITKFTCPTTLIEVNILSEIFLYIQWVLVSLYYFSIQRCFNSMIWIESKTMMFYIDKRTLKIFHLMIRF